jgi:hypothetical protein
MEDNIKMDVREISCEEGKEMEVTQDHVQWLGFGISHDEHFSHVNRELNFLSWINMHTRD